LSDRVRAATRLLDRSRLNPSTMQRL
jgi:hypothetical protein